MHYHWQNLLLSLALCTLSGNGRLVFGGRIPSRGSNHMKRQDAGTTIVEVPRLAALAQYVCSPNANSVKRQASESTSIFLPVEELENIVLVLQELELDILMRINELLHGSAFGSAAPSGASSVAVSISVVAGSTSQAIPISYPTTSVARVSNPSNSVGSANSATPTSDMTGSAGCNDDISTMTIQATQTIPASSIPVIMRDPRDESSVDAHSTTTTSSAGPAITLANVDAPSTITATTVDATSTAMVSCEDLDTTLANVAATSTTTTGSGSASTSSLTGPASIVSSDGGIFIQTSIGSAVTPASGSTSTSSLTKPAATTSSDGGTSLQTSIGSASTLDPGSTSISSLTGSAAATSSDGGTSVQTFIGSASTLDPGSTSISSLTGSAAATSSDERTSTRTSTESASTTATTGPEQTPSNGYVFNAQSSKNVAVYFGQTAVTGGTSLEAQCADPNIDIVILAFVISNTFGGQYPVVNFGAACGGQTPEMISEAPGLLYCPDLANNITSCQSTYGKRVLLSIGGSASQISLTSPAVATSFADTLWDLFGPTGNVDVGLRPFGTVEVDGFDVDNEDNLPSNFDVLAQALRTHFITPSTKRAAQKTYYLSSAPQCPFPDASNPPGLLLLCDFVWVQFYNNPPCEIGSTNFVTSVNQWSSFLENSTMATKPRLYVGAPAFAAAGASAYVAIDTAEGMQTTASEVENLGLSNLGGFMFWDGPEGRLNIEDGKSILAWAKEGLEST